MVPQVTLYYYYRARIVREERSTGEGGSELTEEQLSEDLIDIEDETEQVGLNEEEARKQRIEKKGQALEMRARAMERLGQTKKRIGGDHQGEEQIKKRRSSGDMLEWLKGRIECERKEKEIEQNNKREELEIQSLQHTEILQVLQQISMQIKLFDQYMQQHFNNSSKKNNNNNLI